MKRWVMGAALLALAACETPAQTTRDLDRLSADYQRQSRYTATPENAQQATAADACGASRFRALVGQPIASVDRSALPPRTRIISPGMMVTQDFLPERMNLRVGPDGKVAALECF